MNRLRVAVGGVTRDALEVRLLRCGSGNRLLKPRLVVFRNRARADSTEGASPIAEGSQHRH